MQRTERLFQVIQLLRQHPVLTAAELGKALGVSERTVYRDIQQLARSGVPVAGEAGVGYTLRRGLELPPLTFTGEEVAALVLGSRLVQAWADAPAAKAAAAALQRIEAALPPELRERLVETPVYTPVRGPGERFAARLSELREAIDGRRYLTLRYTDSAGAATARRVRPLGLFFWGWSWTLLAWCELRNDFREFRLDRIAAAEVEAERFPRERGREIHDFLRRVFPAEDVGMERAPGGGAAQGASK
ncbi:MAG: DNA-binding transcriptional regulator [Tepidiforma sp.]|nr:YafY family protein [Tepidiforma sp.]GIW18133.1 MAG: DNA-binding transcriptional regulator [Tepidiforma sp.]